MVIIVHGTADDAYRDSDGKYHEGTHTTFNAFNTIKTEDWEKLSKLKFMPNAIFFCSACNIGTEYDLLAKDKDNKPLKTSGIKEISKYFTGIAIGANAQNSAELPPKANSYRFNSGEYWKVAKNGEYIENLKGIEVITTNRTFKNVINTQQLINMAIKEEKLQKSKN